MKPNHWTRYRSPTAQRGMTLLVSLIFLLILSILGIWSVSNNILQERMAGNTRNRDLAFEAAEAALDHAESTLTTWRTGPFDGSGGLFPYNAVNAIVTENPTQPNDASFWRNSANWISYRQVPVGNLNQVAEQPRFIVELKSKVGKVETYRITARGVGGNSNAVAILQSIVTYTTP